MKEKLENLIIQKDSEIKKHYEKLKQLEKEMEILMEILKTLEEK